MKKAFSVFLAAALSVSMFALAACGGSASSAGGTSTAAAGSEAQTGESTADSGAAAAAGSIVIGGLAPLTGDVSEYGIASNNGSKLAVEEGPTGKNPAYPIGAIVRLWCPVLRGPCWQGGGSAATISCCHNSYLQSDHHANRSPCQHITIRNVI